MRWLCHCARAESSAWGVRERDGECLETVWPFRSLGRSVSMKWHIVSLAVGWPKHMIPSAAYGAHTAAPTDTHTHTHTHTYTHTHTHTHTQTHTDKNTDIHTLTQNPQTHTHTHTHTHRHRELIRSLSNIS